MTITWHPDARTEHKEAIRFSVSHFGKAVGQKLISMLQHNDILLLRNPELGTVEQRLDHLPVTVRYLIIGPYKEYYCIEGDEIHILRLQHCTQDTTKFYTYFDNNPYLMNESRKEYNRTSDTVIPDK